jgi:hypothetical protein
MTTFRVRSLDLSRRALLVGGAVAGSIPLLGVSISPADAKISQAAVAYQNGPKGNQSCATCVRFQPPSSCQTIEGTISPGGWCGIWAQKVG